MSVTDSMMGLNALSKQLIDRPSTAVMVNSKKWTLDNLLDSLFEMDRLPIAVVLDDETALDTLIEMHRRLTLRIPTEQMSVMFRLDKGKKDADAFNQFVRDKALNNYVDKNTKVVYINGYNHNKNLEFKKMKREEIKILGLFGINNPYTI